MATCQPTVHILYYFVIYSILKNSIDVIRNSVLEMNNESF